MSRQPGSGNFYFHPNLNESLETTMAGLVDAADPEAIKGRYIAEHGTETLCSAVINNEMPTDRAFEISKLPSVDQQAAIKAFQALDVGRFKAAHESSIGRKTLSRMTSGAPPQNTGTERG